MNLALVDHWDAAEERQREALQNLDAEMALLGAVLFQNEALALIDPPLPPETFAEPLHAQLWVQMSELIAANRLAEPIVLSQHWEPEDRQSGLRFLADLVDKAPPGRAAPHYASAIS